MSARKRVESVAIWCSIAQTCENYRGALASTDTSSAEQWAVGLLCLSSTASLWMTEIRSEIGGGLRPTRDASGVRVSDLL